MGKFTKWYGTGAPAPTLRRYHPLGRLMPALLSASPLIFSLWFPFQTLGYTFLWFSNCRLICVSNKIPSDSEVLDLKTTLPDLSASYSYYKQVPPVDTGLRKQGRGHGWHLNFGLWEIRAVPLDFFWLWEIELNNIDSIPGGLGGFILSFQLLSPENQDWKRARRLCLWECCWVREKGNVNPNLIPLWVMRDETKRHQE